MCIQNFTNIKHILTVTYKRMCYEIDIFFYRIKNVITIFFSQRRQVDADPGNIYTLTAPQSCFILHLTKQIFGRFINNPQLKITIVNQNSPTYIQIVYEVRIRNGNTFTGSLTFGIPHNFNLLANLIKYWFRIGSGTYLRAFSIHKDSDAIGHGTNIGNQRFKPFTTGVSCVHTNHIHPCIKQLFYKIYIATSV